MKLTSELLLEQLLSQFLPGFDHERDALGAPLLEPRLHPIGRAGFTINAMNGTPVLGAPSHRRASRQLIRSTAMCWSIADGQHDHADQVVDHGKNGQLLQHA